MRQIRRGVFETNSSSVHSITMCPKDDYEKWMSGETYLCENSGWAMNENKPSYNAFYTKQECIEFLNNSKYPPADDFDFNDDEAVEKLLRDNEFYSSENYGYNFEWFSDNYTTKHGDEVVAFGYYGEDR